MYNIPRDICEDYGFHFLENVSRPAMRLVAVGKQSRSSKRYYWDNQSREPAFLFQYTLSGSGTVKLRQKAHIVEKGSAFLLQMPGEECYYFDEVRNTSPWEFIYLMFDGANAAPYYEYVVSRFGNIMHFSPQHPAIKLISDLHLKACNGLIPDAFTADSEVFRFMCLLCGSGTDGDSRDSGLVNSAKTYMENNFAHGISLFDTARYLGVSQSHLSREFVKCTGEPPSTFLTKLRLERGAQLLISTSKGIEEISMLCGFSDSNYFSKVFKKLMKIAPSQFRKQAKAQGYINVKV